MTIPQSVDQAIGHHRAGRLREAEVLYRQILQRAPEHPAALHYLGMLAYQAGHDQDAIVLMGRSLKVAPQIADFHHNFALALRRSGKLEEAIAAWRTVLKLKPQTPTAHEHIGSCLHMMGRPAEAVDEYRAALALKEDFDEARHNLGLALHESGDSAGALECFDRILARRPELAPTHNARGNTLRRLERFDEAIAAYKRAISLAPNHVEPHVGLGNVLKDLNRPEEAAASYQRALAIDPKLIPAHNSLGSAYQKQGRWDEALACYGRAIELRPDHPESHWNRSMVLLLKGDFERGWEEYEWRFKCRDFPGGPRAFDKPRWEGTPNVGFAVRTNAEAVRTANPTQEGRTILLHAEQGLGDTLQFVRYAAAIKRLGYRILVETQPELADLLRTIEAIDDVIPRGPRGQPLPPFDLHAPMLSLPLLMGTTVATIPADGPYIHADAPRVAKWRERLRGDGPAVGLVWAGSPRHPNDRNRSIPLELFRPLLAVPGVRLFSLQKGPAREQLARAGVNDPDYRAITDLADELPDLSEAAAAVAALDLVITVDTLMAHLAGAMARPVWTLLPFDPDFRWLLGRDDSPWYPTMRLFRQRTAGDWAEAFGRVAYALHA